MPIAISVFAFSVACLATMLATPALRRVAVRLRWRDRGDVEAHKARGAARPQVGGLAALLAVAGTLVGLTFAFESSEAVVRAILVGLGPSVLLVTGVGLVDDLRGCRPLEKLTVQLAATAVVVTGTVLVGDGAVLAASPLPVWATLGLLGLWMISTTNATNLVDGIDGLAPSLSALAAAGATVLGVLLGDFKTVLLGSVLAGAAMGFLRSNRHPARAYLGDSGSMLFGFLVGALGVRLIALQPTPAMVVAVICLSWIPLLDTILAVVRRVRSRVSPFRADRDHLHHRLVARGASIHDAARSLGWLGAAGAAAGIGTLLVGPVWAWPTALGAIGVAVLARVVLPLKVTTHVPSDPKAPVADDGRPSAPLVEASDRAA